MVILMFSWTCLSSVLWSFLSGSVILIGGDFNVHFNDSSNARTEALICLLISFGLYISDPVITRGQAKLFGFYCH